MPANGQQGTVEGQLSAEQVRSLVEWADETPGVNGPVLLEKLRGMGVDCGMNAVYTFKKKHITPAIEQLRAAKALASEMADEIAGGDNIAAGSNLLIQKQVFNRALAMQQAGVDVGSEEVRRELLQLHAISVDGMTMRTQGRIADARIDKMNAELDLTKAKLAQMEAEKQKALAAVDELTQSGAEGASLKARNALRMELGLQPLAE